MPAPDIAVKYYTGSDLYLFGEFIHPDFVTILQSFRVFIPLISSLSNWLMCCLQMSSKHPELPILEDQ